MWSQILNLFAGLWLMAASTVLGYDRPLATSDHIAGPLVATFACIAIWECTRSLRWVNLPLGAWIIVAPFVLGAPAIGVLNGAVCGTAIAYLATQSSEIQHRFGGGWSVLWQSANRHP